MKCGSTVEGADGALSLQIRVYAPHAVRIRRAVAAGTFEIQYITRTNNVKDIYDNKLFHYVPHMELVILTTKMQIWGVSVVFSQNAPQRVMKNCNGAHTEDF